VGQAPTVIHAGAGTPQYFPHPRQLRQRAIADEAGGGVNEGLPCWLAPELEIVEGCPQFEQRRTMTAD